MKKKPTIEQHSDPAERAIKKRPYTPPGIVCRELLEATAAACAPAPPGKAAGQCAQASS